MGSQISSISLLWVFLGGGVGASLRFILLQLFPHANKAEFPYTIFAINILGSFAIGILAQIVSRETFSNYAFLQPLLMAGILGGFTTFSAFSLDVLALMQAGKALTALTYVICSVVFSILAAYAGYLLAR
jgi:CrcB protein